MKSSHGNPASRLLLRYLSVWIPARPPLPPAPGPPVFPSLLSLAVDIGFAPPPTIQAYLLQARFRPPHRGHRHSPHHTHILSSIPTRVHNIGRFHSCAQPLAPVAATSTLSKAALYAAVLEDDEDDNTESDGENSERTD
ncbi:hypothetical protein B0H11DRAFT_2214419 [Mycena galericulata]|nr:hypothetical protein B0H11DRAFT_2214419 [Mycena galericulata]